VLHTLLDLAPTEDLSEWEDLFVLSRALESLPLELRTASWLFIAPELASTASERSCRENALRLFVSSSTDPSNVSLDNISSMAAAASIESLPLVIASILVFVQRRAQGPRFSTAGAIVFLRCIELVLLHLQGTSFQSSLQMYLHQAEELLVPPIGESALAAGFFQWVKAAFAGDSVHSLSHYVADCAKALGRSLSPASRPDLQLIAEDRSMIIHSDSTSDRLHYLRPGQFKLGFLRRFFLAVDSYPEPGQQCSISLTIEEVEAPQQLFTHAFTAQEE
jgi:hypothetical protein